MLSGGIQSLRVVIYKLVGWGDIPLIQGSELEQRIKELLHIQKAYYTTLAAEPMNIGQEYYIKKKSGLPFDNILFPIG